MKLFHKTLCCLSVLALAAGCIKEDLSQCNNTTIALRYTGDGTEDIIADVMDKVDLYVFDNGGNCRHIFTCTGNEIKNGATGKGLRLDSGIYTITALGNPGARTSVSGLESKDPEHIYFHNPGLGSGRIPGNDANYLGSVKMEITDGKEHNHGVIDMRSSHIDVRLEIYGLPAPAKAGPAPAVSIEEANARTSFTNRPDPDTRCTYIPVLNYDSKEKCYRTDGFHIPRMDIDGTFTETLCRHTLNITDEKGEKILSRKISEYIEENSKYIDITAQEAVLPIKVEFKGTEVTIEVPGWAIEDTETEF